MAGAWLAALLPFGLWIIGPMIGNRIRDDKFLEAIKRTEGATSKVVELRRIAPVMP
jgi:hypothetical protein